MRILSTCGVVLGGCRMARSHGCFGARWARRRACLIEAFVADLESGPSALVLVGEAGIGKTILWSAGVEAARQSGGCVLTCRGVEAEASLSFSGLSELLAPVLDDVTRSLASPRRRALEVALLLVEPGEVAPDAHAVGLAVLEVLRLLSEQGPMVVALDDAQWLDPASAGALQIGLRRLHEAPVGLFVTVREAPGLSVPIEFDRCFDAERLRRLAVGPLSLGSVHRLLKDHLALDLARPELVRLHTVTRGIRSSPSGWGASSCDEHPADGRGDGAGACECQRVPRRSPGPATDGDGDFLLQVAALARPTVELVAAAHGTHDTSAMPWRRRCVRACRARRLQSCVSRIRCTRRCATSRRRCGSAVRYMGRWPWRLPMWRSGPGTWRGPWKVPTLLSPPRWRPPAQNAAARGARTAGAELFELAAELTPAIPPWPAGDNLRAADLHRFARDGSGRARARTAPRGGPAGSGTGRRPIRVGLDP